MGQGGREGFVFPGGKRGKPLSNMALLALLKRIGRTDLTAHGFRSTFRDWAAERTHFAREVCEAALAHAIPDKVEAAYRRGDLFEKRWQLMDAWARHCGTVAREGAEVTLRPKASRRQRPHRCQWGLSKPRGACHRPDPEAAAEAVFQVRCRGRAGTSPI